MTMAFSWNTFAAPHVHQASPLLVWSITCLVEWALSKMVNACSLSYPPQDYLNLAILPIPVFNSSL